MFPMTISSGKTRPLLAFLLALVAGGALAPGASAAPPAAAPALDLKGLRVLVCDGYFDLMALPAIHRLQVAGAEVRPGSLASLTWDQASRFHLIIAVDTPPPAPVKSGDNSAQVLEKFVKSGGSLLFFKNFTGSDGADQYLAPFGASIPVEIIQDPTHTWKEPFGFGFPYDYTTKITPGDPVTAGVKTVWYPAQRGYMNSTWPLKTDQNWKILVTAEPEASSLWVGGLNEEEKSKPGIYPTAPPFLASRSYGSGAIVLYGLSPFEMFLGQDLPAYLDVLLEKGNGLIPSDTGRLYINAVNYLASHALNAVQTAPAALAPAVPGHGDLPPLGLGFGEASPVPDWSQDVTGGDWCTHPAHGVIGAHSTLSDGQATPEALIAKAQALGLNWLSFTERLEDFSPAKWEQLRKICKDASTPQFQALPGWDYADQNGTRYVVFGDFAWPPDKCFSADKKRVILPVWWFNIGTPPLGPYDISHSPLRYWDLSLYNMYPIRTTLQGKQVDENVDGYRYMQGCMDDPFPMAVDMVRDVAGLEAASHRMMTYVIQDMPRNIQKLYQDHMYYGSYYGFVSDGPIVTDWHTYNETRNTGGKWYLPGSERFRVKLSVHSTAAITDIKIYDGPYLFRRFLPNQAQVTLTFDGPHDMQHQLTADITDAAGRRAITGATQIRDWLNFRFMCGDRGNSICDGVQTDDMGAYLTGPTAPYQRKMTAFGVCPGYGERHFVQLPPDFDGGMRPFPMSILPWFETPGFSLFPAGATPEAKNQISVCSKDGLLQGDDIVGYFPSDTNSWAPKPAPQDVSGLPISYRYLDLTPRAHDPGVLLVEGQVHFDRPLTVTGAHLFSIFAATSTGEGDHYAIDLPGTTVAGLGATVPYNASGPAVPGSYAELFPSPWDSGGALVLDDGYSLEVSSKSGNGHVGLSLTGFPRQFAAGDTLTYRFLVMHGPARELPNNDFWERFGVSLGLRGAPAYQVSDIKTGSVAGTKFLLELTPADGAFVGKVSYADLPIRLPVRVAHMNPNWTFGWFNLDRKEWYPSALDRQISSGYFTIDTRLGATRFFAGHPVLADDPDLRIAVFSDAKTKIEADLNNVKDLPVSVTVRLNPALGPAAPQQLTLQPGELKRVTFAWTPK